MHVWWLVAGALGAQLALGGLGVQVSWIERACEMGSVNACLSRAETPASNPATAEAARPYFERACAAGSSFACRKSGSP